MADGPHASATPLLSGIYAIVNDTHSDPVALVRAVLAGGVRIVQYRAKRRFDEEHARTIRALTREYGALFILNDRWRDAERFGADGAHVGPDDAQWAQLPSIREALGSRVLGVSCGTEEEARIANAAGADYIGVGAVYATSSKDDAGTPIGIAGLARIAGAAHCPVAAIGGITRESIGEVRRAGAAMAAVISAIAAQPDPRAATAALVAEWRAQAG